MTFEKELETVWTYDFKFDNKNTDIFFAFCFPYTTVELEKDQASFQKEVAKSPNIYYKREFQTRSYEGRKIDLITISGNDRIDKNGKQEPILNDTFMFPNRDKEKRCVQFEKGKLIVFLSARVHPGETPASFGIKGVIKKLLKPNDKQSQIQRSMFVFKIIPMINPDGVYRGHFRKDGFGNNQNRFYDKADPIKQPTVFAICELIQYYKREKNLFFFCDFHAHHGVKNCFQIGNSLEFVMQVEARVYAKQLSINSQWIDYNVCSFTKKNMKAKDLGDNQNKEGSARVSCYKMTNLPHLYTLEFGYHQNIEKGYMPNDKDAYDTEIHNYKGNILGNDRDNLQKRGPDKSLVYTQRVFENIGDDILSTLLDQFERNIYNTSLRYKMKRNVENIRGEIAQNIRKDFIKKEGGLDYKVQSINSLIKSTIYDKFFGEQNGYKQDEKDNHKDNSNFTKKLKSPVTHGDKNGIFDKIKLSKPSHPLNLKNDNHPNAKKVGSSKSVRKSSQFEYFHKESENAINIHNVINKENGNINSGIEEIKTSQNTPSQNSNHGAINSYHHNNKAIKNLIDNSKVIASKKRNTITNHHIKQIAFEKDYKVNNLGKNRAHNYSKTREDSVGRPNIHSLSKNKNTESQEANHNLKITPSIPYPIANINHLENNSAVSMKRPNTHHGNGYQTYDNYVKNNFTKRTTTAYDNKHKKYISKYYNNDDTSINKSMKVSRKLKNINSKQIENPKFIGTDNSKAISGQILSSKNNILNNKKNKLSLNEFEIRTSGDHNEQLLIDSSNRSPITNDIFKKFQDKKSNDKYYKGEFYNLGFNTDSETKEASKQNLGSKTEISQNNYDASPLGYDIRNGMNTKENLNGLEYFNEKGLINNPSSLTNSNNNYASSNSNKQQNQKNYRYNDSSPCFLPKSNNMGPINQNVYLSILNCNTKPEISNKNSNKMALNEYCANNSSVHLPKKDKEKYIDKHNYYKQSKNQTNTGSGIQNIAKNGQTKLAKSIKLHSKKPSSSQSHTKGHKPKFSQQNTNEVPQIYTSKS